MPRLRRLSGAEVVTILERFGFIRIAQKGSHVKLRRVRNGARETLIVPLHRELDTGTLRAIVRQASRFVAPLDLQPHFYAEG